MLKNLAWTAVAALGPAGAVADIVWTGIPGADSELTLECLSPDEVIKIDPDWPIREGLCTIKLAIRTHTPGDVRVILAETYPDLEFVSTEPFLRFPAASSAQPEELPLSLGTPSILPAQSGQEQALAFDMGGAEP